MTHEVTNPCPNTVLLFSELLVRIPTRHPPARGAFASARASASRSCPSELHRHLLFGGQTPARPRYGCLPALAAYRCRTTLHFYPRSSSGLGWLWKQKNAQPSARRQPGVSVYRSIRAAGATEKHRHRPGIFAIIGPARTHRSERMRPACHRWWHSLIAVVFRPRSGHGFPPQLRIS